MLLDAVFDSLSSVFGLVATLTGAITIAAYLLVRGHNMRIWGKRYGLTRNGNHFAGEYNESHVELTILETRRESQGKGKEYKHYLYIEAAATIAGPVPEGLHIEGARYRGEMQGEKVETADRQFDEAFRVHAIDVKRAQGMLRAPGMANVMLNLRARSPDLKVLNGIVHLRMSIQQQTSGDPRDALDQAFTTVLRAAQAVSWASHGKPQDDELATSRPEERIKRSVSLPQRKLGREI